MGQRGWIVMTFVTFYTLYKGLYNKMQFVVFYARLENEAAL